MFGLNRYVSRKDIGAVTPMGAFDRLSSPPRHDFDPPIKIPKNRREVVATFGDPGIGRSSVDPKWERAHMVIAKNLPGQWNKGRGRLYVHRLAEPFLREALRACQMTEFLSEIKQIGCWNFRYQRHDPTRPLSYHSWGIALDIDHVDNAPRELTDEVEPYTATWRRLWPHGISWGVVSAFESIGWRWGGRWRPFCDPMHFQLVG